MQKHPNSSKEMEEGHLLKRVMPVPVDDDFENAHMSQASKEIFEGLKKLPGYKPTPYVHCQSCWTDHNILMTEHHWIRCKLCVGEVKTVGHKVLKQIRSVEMLLTFLLNTK